MGPEVPGQLLIWYAFAANIVAGIAFSLVARGRYTWLALAHWSYRLLFGVVLLASAYLFFLIFSHDFRFKYVYEYSDSALPFFYLLSAFWAGQEGTYLLWLLLSVLFGFVILRRGGAGRHMAMAMYSVVNCFLLVMLLKISPFALLPFLAPDGAGLNPLLQDPWMVIHPPIMFVGYAAAGVPFALTLAALIGNDFSDWIRRVLPWMVVSVLMLGAGNILGGYWAYKTLGWGGYWGWDPVENSSFIPWFVSLAALHGYLLQKRSGALHRANVLVSLAVFVLVVYGTFLTRSGVLSEFSVHSFVDLGANTYLIGFMLLFVIGSLAALLWRAASIRGADFSYNIFGRDFSLFTGMALLLLFAAIVWFWTSLPLLSSLVLPEPRAADVATYNVFALPFAILFALLLTVAPFSGASLTPKRWPVVVGVVGIVAAVLALVARWLVPRTDLVFAVLFVLAAVFIGVYLLNRKLIPQLLPALVTLVVAIVTALLLGVRTPLYLLFFGLAAMAVVSNIIQVVRRLPRGWRVTGGQLAHFGFGLMLIGILSSSAFGTSEHLVLPRDENADSFGLTVTYNGMENAITVPHNRLRLTLEGGNDYTVARPELYFSERMDGMMKKPYIHKYWLYDLYFSPQQIEGDAERSAIWLQRDEQIPLGEFTFTFIGFETGGHDTEAGAMRVSAVLVVADSSRTDTVRPALSTMPGASSELIELPAEFADGRYTVTIERINADIGAVAIRVPGLIEEDPERLVLDISRKPLINLVWLGTGLILLGGIIVFVRRRTEMPG